ncbi:alanine racemase 3 [Salmonella enterica]|nr:alanine racemase 3 [Salmonella enterica]
MMKLAEIQAASGVLCVDLAAVVDNYQTLARHVVPAQCGAVLKANGYGLGAEAIAPALYAANCRIFFVAQLSEGVALRKILSADAMVVLLNGVMPQAMPFCCAQQITPLLNSVDQVMTWLALQETRSQRRPVLIQLDSGMSRLGVTPEQLARLAAIFRQRGWAAPDYIISHLANADRPDHALNVYQHTLLQQAKEAFPTSRYSLANSCGMFLHPAWREDLCRPGVALFGVAQPWFSTPLKPAFTLTLSILRVQDVPVGTPIGYGSTVTTTRPLRIATVSAGYADGIPRNLRPPAGVCWRGVRLPVLGRVCMDSFMVDASAIMPTPGDVVEFIGVSQTLEEVAAACDTIPYEIMTRLGGRFRRIMQPAEA